MSIAGIKHGLRLLFRPSSAQKSNAGHNSSPSNPLSGTGSASKTGSAGLRGNSGTWAWVIWCIPFILTLGGIVMISSLAMRNGMASGEDFYAIPSKQTGYAVVGIAAAVASLELASPHRMKKYASKFLILSVFLVFLTILPGVGIRVGGARRWLGILGFRFQPIELLMVAVPIFMAERLNYNKYRDRRGFGSFLHPTLMLIIVLAPLIMMQPNLGGTVLMASVCFIMHWERKGIKWIIFGVILAAAACAVAVYLAPYRMNRFTAFLKPWEDPSGKSFQIVQGLVAFANGGLTGVGVGKGLQEKRFMPEAHTDYILPSIGEEFGIVVTMGILLLYAVWTVRMHKTYTKLRDPFLKSVLIGLTASVICPMFLNIGGVTNLMPLTGVPMSFMSYGGSAMVCMWIKIGILAAIDKIAFGGSRRTGQ